MFVEKKEFLQDTLYYFKKKRGIFVSLNTLSHRFLIFFFIEHVTLLT